MCPFIKTAFSHADSPIAGESIHPDSGSQSHLHITKECQRDNICNRKDQYRSL